MGTALPCEFLSKLVDRLHDRIGTRPLPRMSSRSNGKSYLYSLFDHFILLVLCNRLRAGAAYYSDGVSNKLHRFEARNILPSNFQINLFAGFDFSPT